MSKTKLREEIRGDVYPSRMKLVESSEQKRPGVLCTVEGVLMVYDQVNRNNRIYPKSLVENMILNAPYTKEMLLNRTFFGEAQHPGDDRNEVWASNASHNITKMWIDESQGALCGRIDVLDTPAGRVVKTLIEYGSVMGVSARAAGTSTANADGVEVIDEDTYDFRTFDFVTAPGFLGARVNLTESMNNADLESRVEKTLNEEKVSKETLMALRTLIESTESQKLKDLLPVLEQKLTQAANDAEGEHRVLVEKANELQEQCGKLQEQLAEMTKERDALRKTLTETRRQFGGVLRNRASLKEEMNKINKRVSIMESTLKRNRVSFKKAEPMAPLTESVVTAQNSTPKPTNDGEDARLRRLLAKKK